MIRDKLQAIAQELIDAVMDATRQEFFDAVTEVSSKSNGVHALRSAPAFVEPPVRSARTHKTGMDGRPGRRSTDEIDSMVERVCEVVSREPGIRAENIRQELGLDARDLMRPLRLAVQNGRIHSTGQKRATSYFEGGVASPKKIKGLARKVKSSGPKGLRPSAKKPGPKSKR